jgi:pre-rRNA-processing protein TSR3
MPATPTPLTYPKTVVIRHRKENLKKCSLRGLESRPDFQFHTYPSEQPLEIRNCIILSVDAPELSPEDSSLGLLIIDATWRYAVKMLGSVKGESCLYRSLPPHYRTAYPRRQEDCPDPERGLASIEAIYLAYMLLGRPLEGLLDGYYWKEGFLKKNNL